MLAQLYLSGVGGEEEHDGEARQQAGVLDGEGEEEAAAARVLFLTTHLVHLWELRDRKTNKKELDYITSTKSGHLCLCCTNFWHEFVDLCL